MALRIGDESVTLTSEDVQVERVVKEGLVAVQAGQVTVALNTDLTEELLLEGLARELKNKINTMRKEAGLAVTDRIHLVVQGSARLKMAFDAHKDAIAEEVLATKVTFAPCEGTTWDINGEETVLSLMKAP